MKRSVTLLLIIAIVLSLGLVGCQETQTEIPATTANPTEKKPLLEVKRGPRFDLADNTEFQGFSENDPYVAGDSSASGGEYCFTQIPNVLYDPDTDLVYLNYTRHRDVSVNYPYDSTKVFQLDTLLNASINAQLQKDYTDMVTENTMFFTGMTKLRDGTIFCQNYMTYYITDTTATTYSWLVDGEGNWQQVEGILTIPQELAARGPQPGVNWHRYAFSRCLIELEDGTLLGSMYGTYGAIMVESPDRGKTWNYRSTIALSAYGREEPYINTDGTTITWFEPGVTRCADGSLLCVMRTWRNKPLWQTRSFDDGMTWTEPTLMPGIEGESIYPQLLLLSNGVLALSTGVPGNSIYLSLDGCGYNWDRVVDTYLNDTTGNNAITEIGYDEETDTVTLLAVGDKGFNNKSLSGIWGRTVTVTRNHVEEPALKKVVIRADETMVSPGDTLPIRLDGIFTTDATVVQEGYTVQWESMVPEYASVDETGLITALSVGAARFQAIVTWGDKTVKSNTLSIKVHDDKVLESIEVTASKWVLKPSEQGNVIKKAYNSFGDEMNADLVQWQFDSMNSKLLQVDAYTGEYQALAAGVTELLVSATKDGVKRTKKITIMIESDQWVTEGFEGEGLPKNCIATNLVSLSTNRSYSGKKSVYINDNSSTLSPSLRFTMPDSKGIIVEFMIYVENNEHSSVFGVGAPKSNGQYNYACNTARLGVLYNPLTGNQGYQAYDGKAWSRNNRNNVLPRGQWNKIRLEVTSDKPYNFYINDKFMASLPVATVNDVLNTLHFSSGGTPSTGDAFYIDDIRYMVFD